LRKLNSLKVDFHLTCVTLIKTKISNGILESINAKIQLAKRRARGFRNNNNFIVAGKLKYDYPLYST